MKFWKPVLTRVAIYGGAMLFVLHWTAAKFERTELISTAIVALVVFAFEAVLQLTRNGDSQQ